MSIDAISFVWMTSKAAKTELLMLLALADWANELGECWPGIKAIAEKARMTERNAQILLRKLASTGAIIIEENAGVETRTGNTNRYTIVGFVEWLKEVKRISPLKPEGVKNSATRGEKSGTKGVKHLSPKPLDKPSDKPVKEYIAPASQDATPKSENRIPLSENENPKVENDNLNPAIQEKALSPLQSSAKVSPLPDLITPEGKTWIYRHDKTRHLIRSKSKQAGKTMCGQDVGSYGLMVLNPEDYIECAECLKRSTPKQKTSRGKWHDLTDAMHEAIPEAIRPPGRPHYGKNTDPAYTLWMDGFTAQDVRAYVTWVYVHDQWYCCGGPGGTPVQITMHAVQKNIKGWKSVQGKDSSNGHKSGVLGNGNGSRTKTDYGF